MSLPKWFLVARPRFLILQVVLIAHGAALALWQESFNGYLIFLAVVGLVLLNVSVNLLNDWHDYARSGIDKLTQRTPYSGGRGYLADGEVSARGMLLLGLTALAIGSAIGLYLLGVSGWPLLVIGIIGVFTIVAYSPFLSRINVGEISAGLSSGTLPVVGVYYLLAGQIGSAARKRAGLQVLIT